MYMYCPNCGLNNPDNALNYSACGAALGAQAPGAAPPVTPTAAPVAQKSKLTAGLLAIFLGTLGIHNFYLGVHNKSNYSACGFAFGRSRFRHWSFCNRNLGPC